MITIVDYDTGNLRSVENAFRRLGAQYRLSGSADEIRQAEKVLLPGVGEASTAMYRLRERGLVEVIKNLTQPVLGICLGMQLLCSHSQEKDTPCLGIFDNRVERLKGGPQVKIPHMGWNALTALCSELYRGIEEGSYVYFVHSYAAQVNQNTIAVSTHGEPFSASLHKDNFFGCQFHPEKSGLTGQRILQNFLTL